MGRLAKSLRDRGVFRVLTATMRGHRRPDEAARGASCLIHTARCTYALDEGGFCCDVIPVDGALPRGVERCRGAQYVASLDLRTEEGLVGDPRIGARALFVGRGTGLRMALLKTAEITRVEHRDPMRVRSDRWRTTQHGLATVDAVPRPSTVRGVIPSVPVPHDLLSLLRS